MKKNVFGERKINRCVNMVYDAIQESAKNVVNTADNLELSNKLADLLDISHFFIIGINEEDVEKDSGLVKLRLSILSEVDNYVQSTAPNYDYSALKIYQMMR